MLLFRSLALGLLGACLMMLARPRYEVHMAPAVAAPASSRSDVQIVDVAAGVAPYQVGALVHLQPAEHVVAVGERSVATDLEAGAIVADSGAHSGGYLDLTVGGPLGPRRVLVLLH
jgi:hypothetical protein